MQKLDHTYSVSSPGRAFRWLSACDALCCTGDGRGPSISPANAKQCICHCQLWFYYMAVPYEALSLWINLCSKFTEVALMFLYTRSK